MPKNLKNKLEYFINVRLRLLPFFYKIHISEKAAIAKPKIIGMIRERNESLLLRDSLDHLAEHVDAIVVFDDASTDDSVEIAKNHPAVLEVIENRYWRRGNRIWEEATNRKKLHDRAKRYNPEWLFYCDADERFEGDIKKYLKEGCPEDVNAVRISLLDAYITQDDQAPYERGKRLYNFRKYFGPERRDILMIWRNHQGADFRRKDGREPQCISRKNEITRFYCQHYGKSLSIEHWEETCDYYIKYFPKYSDKWRERKGKAVHSLSDFGTPLFKWEEAKLNSVKIN